MGAPVAFFEVISDDPERSRTFYSEMFGWQASPAMGGYALVDTRAGEDAIGGGIGPAAGAGDTGVKIYMRVVPPTDLPGDFGRFAIFADPDGNPVGPWS